MILAGDIGGTKAHFALYEPGGTPRRPALDRVLPTPGSPSLEALLLDFLGHAKTRPTRAVLGVAGPVVDNRCVTTNLPWQVDGAILSRELGGVPVTLLNDLEANAWGLQTLGPADLHVLQAGQPAPGNRALIAAGTGLGEAVLVWDGARWHPSASEGGHADLAARDPLEDELLQWLRRKYQHVSYERVLSGPGLADVYRFLGETKRGAEPPEVAARFAAAEQPAAIVTETALDGSCERAQLALHTFVEVYGAEAGNLALKTLAIGGLFIGGGIAPRMPAAFEDGRFLAAFADKGRLRPLMERIPIALVLDAQAALWGAAALALGI